MQVYRILRGMLALASGLCFAGLAVQPVQAGPPNDMPIDKVDPFWPKPLPNKWILGETVKGGLNMRKELEARALRLQKPKGLV